MVGEGRGGTYWRSDKLCYCALFPFACAPMNCGATVLQLFLMRTSLHSFFLKSTELYLHNQILCNTEVLYTLFTAAHEIGSESFHPKQLNPAHLFIYQS